MFAFCSLTWWKKPEYPEETTDRRQAMTTVQYADTGDRIRAFAVISEGFTHALFRLCKRERPACECFKFELAF